MRESITVVYYWDQPGQIGVYNTVIGGGSGNSERSACK